jgi:hypothetical protein
MRNVIGPVVSLATMLFIGPSARADVIPPDVYACNGKQLGDACSDTSVSGICQTSSCTKLDYSQWNRDASSGPPSTTYACVKCAPGTVTSTKTATSTPMDAGTALDAGTMSNTQTATSTPTATATATSSSTQTATASPTATGTLTDTNTNTDTSQHTNDDGWCTVGRGSAAKRVAPWAMAAAFSIFFLWARRRRR